MKQICLIWSAVGVGLFPPPGHLCGGWAARSIYLYTILWYNVNKTVCVLPVRPSISPSIHRAIHLLAASSMQNKRRFTLTFAHKSVQGDLNAGPREVRVLVFLTISGNNKANKLYTYKIVLKCFQLSNETQYGVILFSYVWKKSNFPIYIFSVAACHCAVKY